MACANEIKKFGTEISTAFVQFSIQDLEDHTYEEEEEEQFETGEKQGVNTKNDIIA